VAISLNYLASHTRNYEALLQTYRQINLTTQSVFLILGTFLLSNILAEDRIQIMLFWGILLIVLTLFSVIVMWRFHKVIVARGEDVNWWHERMIETEEFLPSEERTFTNFKLYQSRDTISTQVLNSFHEKLTSEEIHLLLGTDLDKIRNVINSYILRGMVYLWISLNIISAGYILFSLPY
jgi:hypothetical protein